MIPIKKNYNIVANTKDVSMPDYMQEKSSYSRHNNLTKIYNANRDH